MLTKTQKEELRHTVREFLACRSRLAFTPDQVRAMLARRPTLDFTPEAADIEEACVFLEGMSQAAKLTDELGSSTAYQITPHGVLAYERSVR